MLGIMDRTDVLGLHSYGQRVIKSRTMRWVDHETVIGIKEMYTRFKVDP
jgi:hypothetical protein